MLVRKNVPWLEPPARHFTAHGYSELIASNLEYVICGKTVEVSIPKSIPFEEREIIINRLLKIGFDGIVSFETSHGEQIVKIKIVVE